MKIHCALLARVLGLCAIGALFLAGAPVAFSQDGGTDEEEEFYRASDPEDPLRPGEVSLSPERYHNVALSIRGGQGVGARSDLDPDDSPMSFQLQYLWQALKHDHWYHLEIGAEMGMVLEQAWSTEQQAPLVFEEAVGDYDSGINVLPNHSVLNLASEFTILYAGVLARMDLWGLSRWDLGPSVSLDLTYIETDTVWGCDVCDGTSPVSGTGDTTEVGMLFRIGVFFGYQFDYVTVGIEVGVSAYFVAEPASLGAVDGGITIGVPF